VELRIVRPLKGQRRHHPRPARVTPDTARHLALLLCDAATRVEIAVRERKAMSAARRLQKQLDRLPR
jgi:hypothetical protein